MQNKKNIYMLIFLLVLSFILFAIISYRNDEGLKVVFFDVGQGDAILISQGNKQILIDGGKSPQLLLEKLGKYIPFWDRTLEIIIISHPDQDHIGGLVDAIEKYKVDYVLKTNQTSDSQIYKALEENIKNEEIGKIEAVSGLKINLENTQLEIVYPFEKVTQERETNKNSIVAQLKYGENEFLFTGDLPSEQENVLISKGIDIESDYLKVSHHGSKYATSNEFLDLVKSKEAIISAGKNNSYGHPNEEVLQRLIQYKINIFRTDQSGDVIYECLDKNFQCQRILK